MNYINRFKLDLDLFFFFLNILFYIYLNAKNEANADANAIDNMTATLTINKANYDMSNIKFEDKVVDETVDLNEKALAITGTLPEGLSVTYENNDNTLPGEYDVIAKFSSNNSNYNLPESMIAHLTINAVNNGLPVGAVIGIVVGSIVLIGGAALLIFRKKIFQFKKNK